MKQGQSWTVDFTLGMLMFLAALALVSGNIGDLLDQQNFNNLLQDATRLSEAIMSEGYPDNWDATDVIRLGILSDERLSWRKLGIMQTMSESTLRATLPSAYNYAFTLENASGDVLGFQESCSFGTSLLPQSITSFAKNFSVAYYSRSDGPTELKTWAVNTMGGTAYTDGALVSLLRDAHQYGVIIFEDPLFNRTLNITLTATLLREEFRKAATYGPTILLTGMLGTPVLGVNTTLDVANGTVQAHNEPYFLLNETDTINFTTTYDVNFMPKQGGILGNLDGAIHQQTIVNAGGSTAAVWQYEDSPVYYFSDATGNYNTDSLRPIIQQGLARAALRTSVNCTVSPELINTPDLIKIDRLIADRGEIYSLKLYVWRNP